MPSLPGMASLNDLKASGLLYFGHPKGPGFLAVDAIDTAEMQSSFLYLASVTPHPVSGPSRFLNNSLS